MLFFADHGVPSSVAEAFERSGHEVTRLPEHLPTDAPDAQVMAEAQRLDAILLSLNGDFSDLVRYPPRAYEGIVALQVKGCPEGLALLTRRLIGYLEAHPERAHYRGTLLPAGSTVCGAGAWTWCVCRTSRPDGS
jgi:predicted nuclease of predicted toxin-antitoxin system